MAILLCFHEFSKTEFCHVCPGQCIASLISGEQSFAKYRKTFGKFSNRGLAFHQCTTVSSESYATCDTVVEFPPLLRSWQLLGFLHHFEKRIHVWPANGAMKERHLDMFCWIGDGDDGAFCDGRLQKMSIITMSSNNSAYIWWLFASM